MNRAPQSRSDGAYRPKVSVIVVSRGRPVELSLCLRALAQVQYDGFEIIVVADSAGLDAVHAEGLEDRIKSVSCDIENISVARNLGLEQAAGEVIAFIDDDAVPEPTWLAYLVAPFVHETVAATGGFVRGRNGISFQWKAESIDGEGVSRRLRMKGDEAMLFHPTSERAIKTQGTNCAFRREVFDLLGGFDPAYRFYLDESDLNMRIAKAGGKTVIVPLAQVHHGYAASAQRRRDRAPRDLTLIGESLAVYHRKYLGAQGIEAAMHRAKQAQRKRLLQFMLEGALLPTDIPKLLAGFSQGYEAGKQKSLSNPEPIAVKTSEFMSFETRVAFGVPDHLGARVWRSKTAHAKARAEVAAGRITSLFILSPTALFHHVRFHPDGYWLQKGGIWGRSSRTGPLIVFSGFSRRIRRERARCGTVRGFLR